MRIVAPTDVWTLRPAPVETLALTACHPPRTDVRRLVVGWAGGRPGTTGSADFTYEMADRMNRDVMGDGLEVVLHQHGLGDQARAPFRRAGIDVEIDLLGIAQILGLNAGHTQDGRRHTGEAPRRARTVLLVPEGTR